MNLIKKVYRGTNFVLSQIKQKCYTHIFRLSLWLNDVEFGNNVKTFNAIPDLQIRSTAKKVTIGNNVTFNNFTEQSWYCKCKLLVQENAQFIIGNHSGMSGTMIYVSNLVKIGDYVNIGGGTRIFDTDFHPIDSAARRNPATFLCGKSAPVIIEDDVFIGTNCIIGKGVTIGARSVVAAGSVVVKDVPSDSIVGGNPCKLIRKI